MLERGGRERLVDAEVLVRPEQRGLRDRGQGDDEENRGEAAIVRHRYRPAPAASAWIAFSSFFRSSKRRIASAPTF